MWLLPSGEAEKAWAIPLESSAMLLSDREPGSGDAFDYTVMRTVNSSAWWIQSWV